MSNRDFDIVVWGATGFTGALVAEYLLAQYGIGKDLRWAIAGRSEQKLELLRQALGAEASALPTIVADSFDEQKLDDMAAKTRVVITTVGPYAKYGAPLVAACVANGTHYCDLAGEAQWIRRMIDTHHEAAAGTGARIVHCCGGKAPSRQLLHLHPDARQSNPGRAERWHDGERSEPDQGSTRGQGRSARPR
jgi:short subunit dehydrogenase-like uncharacterized protein